MSAPFNVLVVCVGNICRSPLGERLLRERIRQQLDEPADAVVVESAGLRAVVGHPMDEMAAMELRRLGLTNDDFRARQLTRPMAADADLVLTVTKDLRSRLLEEVPSALRRTFTITEFAALVDGVTADSPRDLVAGAALRRSTVELDTYDVPDPIGAGAAVHREAADLIVSSVPLIARAIAFAVQTESRAGQAAVPPITPTTLRRRPHA